MPRDQPNVLCIIADDLGWRDIGSYGSSFYETPNIDAFSRDGIQFTDAYASAPVCSPTRASVMSGKYPACVSITNWIAGEERGNFSRPSTTIDCRTRRQRSPRRSPMPDTGPFTWGSGISGGRAELQP
ncbi:sulfatase-like hydrolase/transferase [Halocatena marina]|uniref:Sulfatase-like hydrolase/transferase n=1 Tax=Halocatena marina TaxID=2934937 RepID=A0ABD5YUI0_9EURY